MRTRSLGRLVEVGTCDFATAGFFLRPGVTRRAGRDLVTRLAPTLDFLGLASNRWHGCPHSQSTVPKRERLALRIVRVGIDVGRYGGAFRLATFLGWVLGLSAAG